MSKCNMPNTVSKTNESLSYDFTDFSMKLSYAILS
jgi:hypothetical protein